MDARFSPIALLPFNFTPKGWLPCNGQTLNIAGHPKLFALFGSRFGGDGKTTFALPGLSDKAPSGNLTYCVCEDESSQDLLGSVRLFSKESGSPLWAKCAGQLLSISNNSALFSLLGAFFGGNGRTTFALPDLSGKAPSPDAVYHICLNGLYPNRS